MDRTLWRAGPPRILHPDQPTIEKFRQLGLQGASYRGCGEAFNCSKDTIANFLFRYPHVKAIFMAAKGEHWAATELAKDAARAQAESFRAERQLAAMPVPKPGEACPTCGRKAGATEDQIVLTATEIAEAQRTLDELIDRHLAASGADGTAPERQ